MRDLLSLDFSRSRDNLLLGVDIDQKAIDEAKILAKQIRAPHTEFSLQNAWDLELSHKADFICSIGLNVYESNKAKLVDLYSQFRKNLKIRRSLIYWHTDLSTRSGEEIRLGFRENSSLKYLNGKAANREHLRFTVPKLQNIR